MMAEPWGWLSAFLFTQLIEAPLYYGALTRCGAPPSRARRWALALVASALTHPWVYFAFPRWWPGDALSGLVAAEAFAVIGEALWLSWVGLPRSVSWAALANALSAGLGLASRAAWGWP